MRSETGQSGHARACEGIKTNSVGLQPAESDDAGGLGEVSKEYPQEPITRPQPEIRADDPFHQAHVRLGQLVLMHPCNQGLALFATQRHGFCWLLHDLSFETGARCWTTDRIGLTLADELVKPSEIMMPVIDDGVRRSPTDADAALGAVSWGGPVKGVVVEATLAPDHPEASA